MCALEALLSGHTMTIAAIEAGVSRRTVYTWLYDDPSFAVEYNQRRLELIESASQRLLDALEDAVGVVVEAIKNGDTKMAIAILKGAGALNLQNISFDDCDVNNVSSQIDKRRVCQFDDRLLASMMRDRIGE